MGKPKRQETKPVAPPAQPAKPKPQGKLGGTRERKLPPAQSSSSISVNANDSATSSSQLDPATPAGRQSAATAASQSAALPGPAASATPAAEQPLAQPFKPPSHAGDEAAARADKLNRMQPREVPLSSLPPDLQKHIAEKDAAQVAPVPYRLPNAYRANPGGTHLKQQAQAAPPPPPPDELAERERIRLVLTSHPKQTGTDTEREILTRYVQTQLQRLGPADAITEEQQPYLEQAGRLLVHLHTVSLAEQFQELQQLERGNPPVHALLVRLYADVQPLVAQGPAPDLPADPLPGQSVGPGGDWDPQAPQIRHLLQALIAKTEATIPALMELTGLGAQTRALLEQAIAGQLIERGFLGGTGVYRITAQGRRRLAQETKPATVTGTSRTP